MAMDIELPPEMLEFARNCVAEGRFATVDEVLIYSLRLLQSFEPERLAFIQSLKDAQAEADRDGYFTIDQVVAEMHAAIDEVEAENKARVAAE